MADSTPVVRLFFAKIKQAFDNLPEDEKAAFMRKDRENIDALGMKVVTMIDCSWSTDEWDYIGVEQWESMEVIKEREKFEQEVLNISRYVDYQTFLGTPESFAEYGRD